MEQMHQPDQGGSNVAFRLLRGACDSVLNVPRAIAEIATFDPSPDTLSHVKPGLLEVIRQVREERKQH